jgi:hypothetical protein
MSKRLRGVQKITFLLYLAVPALCAGCAIIPGETRIPPHQQVDSRHHLYNAPRTPEDEGKPVSGIAKLDPTWWLENSDDPLPWWWKPDAPLDERRRSWKLRNPFHNFTNYVIGVSDRHTHRMGINARSIWNDQGSFNAAVTQAGPFLYLPMISNRGPFFEWYIGWRELGNFGAALRLAQHDSDGTGPRGRSPLARAIAAGARPEDTEPDGPVPLPPVSTSGD